MRASGPTPCHDGAASPARSPPLVELLSATSVPVMRDTVRLLRDRRLRERHLGTLPVMSPPVRAAKTVLVCSGGGLLGAAQAGMLDALCATGVRFDAIVGVSAGALNGTFIAADPHAERGAELVATWEGLPKRGVFHGTTVERLWALLARHDSLHSGDALRSVVERAVPLEDLSETVIPVHVATCNLLTGKPTWWSAGPTADVLCASAAVPGALPPVSIDGVDHVDGGVVGNVPVGKAVALGATRIVCLDVSSGLTASSSPDTAIGVLLRSFAATRLALTAAEFATIPDRVELHHLRLRPPPGLVLTDFGRVRELVELGRQVARDHLALRPLTAVPASRITDRSSTYEPA